MNEVFLTGNLGTDPEFRETPNGIEICILSVATNESIKRDNQWVDHTEWHRVVVFAGTAKSCAKFLAKGSKVAVRGKIRSNKYTDKEGIERKSFEIIGDKVEFLSKRQTTTNGATPQQPYQTDDEIPF